MRRFFVFAAVILGSSVLVKTQATVDTLWVTLGDIDQLVEVDAYTFIATLQLP